MLKVILHFKQAVWIERLTTVSLTPSVFSSSLFLWPSIKRKQTKSLLTHLSVNDITPTYTIIYKPPSTLMKRLGLLLPFKVLIAFFTQK